MRITNNRNNIVVALVLIALTSSMTLAQGGMGQGQPTPSTKGAVIKGKAPVNKTILRVKLPKAEEASLPNGLRVVLLPSKRVPTFSMQMVVLTRSEEHTSELQC